MKNIMGKGLALGLGLAVKSKEQIESFVDDLVKKGEIKKEESNEIVNELLQKGEETKREIDQMIKERTKLMLNELNLATKEDLQRIEKRVDLLEQKQQQNME